MRKFIWLLLLIPLVCEAWTPWNVARKNARETITAPWNFADTVYFQEATFTYIEVDTIVITYASGKTVMDSLQIDTYFLVNGESFFGDAAADTALFTGRVYIDNGLFMDSNISADSNEVYIGTFVDPMGAVWSDLVFAYHIWNPIDSSGFDLTAGKATAVGLDTLKGLIVLVSQKALIDTLYWDSDYNTYTVGGVDLQRLFTGGIQAYVVGNNGFQINRDLTVDSVLIISSETFLGDTLTDTTTVYRVQHKGSVMFDSLATGVKYLDFSLADNASASTYWLYANSNNYWGSSGSFKAEVISALTEITVGDDKWLTVGTSSDAIFMWETADANANELIIYLPEGGATNVPVGVFGDASIYNVDLGWFNGVTEPRWVVVDDDADSWVGISHSADDTPAIMMGGAAKSFTLPNALTLQLHTIATGDSVFLNMIVDAADTTLKTYNGTTWITIQDLAP